MTSTASSLFCLPPGPVGSLLCLAHRYSVGELNPLLKRVAVVAQMALAVVASLFMLVFSVPFLLSGLMESALKGEADRALVELGALRENVKPLLVFPVVGLITAVASAAFPEEAMGNYKDAVSQFARNSVLL